MKIVRERRDEPEEHKQIDRMKPLKFDELGTPNDPCFGKHYDLKAKECKKCGDCEICAIVSGQNGFLKQIETQEANNSFKELDEAALIKEQNLKIKERIKIKLNKFPDQWLKVDKLIPIFIKEFNLLPKTDDQYVRQRIIQTIESMPKTVSINKALTKYKAK